MSNFDIPTVKIVCGDSYTIINESDFDKTRDTVFEPTPETDAEREARVAAEASEAARIRAEADANAPRDAAGLRLDGPTLAEYVKAGYAADSYPPQGYASKEVAPAAPPAPGDGWGAPSA